MRQKHNPWLSLVALLLLALILAWVCTGCATQAEAEDTTLVRFTVEYFNDGCRIITDNETGVQYLYVAYISKVYGTGVGVCKLEPGQ